MTEYTLNQPSFAGLSPKFPIRFKTKEEGEKYKERLVERMMFYVELRRNGNKVGEKSLPELEQELLDLMNLRVVAI